MQFDVVTVGGGFSGLCPHAALPKRAYRRPFLKRERRTLSLQLALFDRRRQIMGLPIMAEPDRMFRAIMDGSGPTRIQRSPAPSQQRQTHHRVAVASGRDVHQRALQHDQPGQQVLAPPRRRLRDWTGKTAARTCSCSGWSKI